jgi:carbamoyl-phosphate synthase large subunit
MINILLTCAGRRNYLVDYFRQALAGRGQVFASDAALSAPALQEADRAFLVPAVTDPDYFNILLGICRENHVRLLFSLNDLELPLLARQRYQFLAIGTIPVVSSPTVVDLCFDKWATWNFLQEIGVPTPLTFISLPEAQAALSRNELAFPLVVKPRWGTASFGIDYPESTEEMTLSWELGRMRLHRSYLMAASADKECCLIAQEKVTGTEYGLDIVNDLEGHHVTTFVKRKLAMRAGETDKAITVSHPALEAVGRRIGEALRHIGNLDCDVFVDGERFWVLELNPRFGGGYPFTHRAGPNLPAALIAWAQGEEVDTRWLTLTPDVATAKCDRLVDIVNL